MNAFVGAVDVALPGDVIVYATGDLAWSAQWSRELLCTREMAWAYQAAGKGRLFQRRRPDLPFYGGASFDYLFIKARRDDVAD